MRHVFAFALLASAAVLAGCTDEIGVTCPPGQTLCGQVCVYTTYDPNNCGSCGNVCQGQLVCIGGQCGCQTGLTACGNQCVDTKSSVENCGACGNGCPQSQVCSMSACSDTCGTGLTNCNRSCVDPMSDSSNCGGCGNKCGQGEKCTAGVCKAECPAGQTSCNGQCSNLVNDGNNCGACGNVCPNDYFCVFGTCILGCPQPLTRCIPDGGNSDGGSQCVDTRWDPNNCGGCGGADVSPQPSASPFVPHVCTVPDGHHTDPVCDNGRCAATCENGFNDCTTFGPNQGGEQRLLQQASAPAPFALACFDLSSDNCNCGACYNAPIGWIPQFDAVTQASTICSDSLSGGCNNFTCDFYNGPLAAAQICCDSQFTNRNSFASCGSTCMDAVACNEATDTDCCEKSDHSGYACTNTETDIHNCGGCVGSRNGPQPSNDCTLLIGPSGPSGPSGPAPFPGCCGGGCTDLNKDANNCGACGTVCPAPSPSSNPQCCPNLVDRGPGNPTGGCVDFNFDTHNCGGCGNDCAAECTGCAGTSGCFNGSCQCTGCP